MSNYSQNVLFKEILKTSIQKRHVIHFHGNNNIKIVMLHSQGLSTKTAENTPPPLLFKGNHLGPMP